MLNESGENKAQSSDDLLSDLLNGFVSRNAARNRADYQIDLERTPTEPIAEARLKYTRALGDFNRSKYGVSGEADADQSESETNQA